MESFSYMPWLFLILNNVYRENASSTPRSLELCGRCPTSNYLGVYSSTVLFSALVYTYTAPSPQITQPATYRLI